MERVAAVDLDTGRAAGRAAVVAADQEVTGREAGRVEVVEDVADLAGAGVQVALGAVAVEAERVGAAAEAGELAQECGLAVALRAITPALDSEASDEAWDWLYEGRIETRRALGPSPAPCRSPRTAST
ncbi:hypothetical protein K4G64_28275 [Streptomyces sp. WAC04114]|nr:hypothetical protein [Streptomyces sp. WAC04114]